ncbi:hypothetical protein [Aquisphaera insulae]|uniref:hypothetical protein n=1 Tax=Aquisphaera insulae TaxID=2712864 RepID=UPI0013EBB74F|nr:hypothetical protein [Aquisphaera insulae]
MIGHALSMAIESSNLSPTDTASTPTATAPREGSATDRPPTLRGIEARNNAADVRRSAAASQAPGASPVEPYGSGKTAGQIRNEVEQRTAAAAAGAAAPAEPAAVRPDPVAAFAKDHLRRQARQGFEASNRLFEKAAQSTSGSSPEINRFLSHAKSYARILQALSEGKPAVAPETAGNVLSSPTVFAGPADALMVKLVNHGVSQALDSSRLTSSASVTESTDAAQELRRHAQEMKDDSRRIMESVAANYPATATRPQAAGSGTPAAGQGNESVTMLIQEARELLQILDQIGD